MAAVGIKEDQHAFALVFLFQRRHTPIESDA